MAESAVSFLLDQLAVILQKEKRLLAGLEHEVEYIQNELGQMREFLRVADSNEESNSNLKEWVRQLREISYDVQDVLDKYMLQFRLHRSTNGSCVFIIKQVYAPLKNLRARHQIASEIQAINSRLENVSRSQQRYREMYAAFIDRGSSSTQVLETEHQYDGRGDALLLEADDVVGIEVPKYRLLSWIQSIDNGLDVISVVGMGGLGKTTLVKKVYDLDSVKNQFDRHVWIVASDYTDIKGLLANLIKKLVGEMKQPPPQELGGMTVDDMRNFIYEFLKEKKYIIVFDDVWNLSTWEVIRLALPRRDARSCIIITTRFNSIGDAACSNTTGHVYNLEPLPVNESMVLFNKKAFPRENLCPPYLREFAENILRRCEGLPLAIVVIGGLLATKNNRAEEWEQLNRSLTHELEGGGLQRLGKLFGLSYNDLPYYLKYCFLYLSIFPEGGLLEKEKIIRLWMAEGFVRAKPDKTVEEVANNYLNDLFSRSLIQVAEKHIDGRARAFRIHDLLRDYITKRSREQNMVTIYNGEEIHGYNKIRRLAIQTSIPFSHLETSNFEYLRSLLVLCHEDVELEPIKELVTKCRLLKVLELSGAPLETIPKEVFKLYHLKSLRLRNTMVKHIPASIKYLENLETLDLKNSNVTELPKEILKLRRLRHLLVYKYVNKFDATFDSIKSIKVPHGIGKCLRSLQKLCCIDADEVVVSEVGKLGQLRRLGIGKLRTEHGMLLCDSIRNCGNLRSLRIYSVEEGEKLDLNYSLRLPFLRTLDLFGSLESVPRWIPSLHELTTLNLFWSKLREDPLNFLKDLPNLTHLGIHGANFMRLTFKTRGFRKLKQLWLVKLARLQRVVVEKGSMPFLEEWIMEDCKLMTELTEGIEHLTNLQVVGFGYMTDEFVEKADQTRRRMKIGCVQNVCFYNVAYRSQLQTTSNS